MERNVLIIFLLVSVFSIVLSNPISPHNPNLPDIPRCLQPQSSGLCLAYFPSYFYNHATDTCESFIYGGCNGNDNRFFSIEECEAACKGFQPEKKEFKLVLESDEIGESVVDESESAKDDSESESVVTEAVEERRISTEGENESESQSAEIICSQPKVEGQCRAFLQRYFFNGTDCTGFIYGGCSGNANNFKTVEECREKCGPKSSEVSERTQENSANAVSEEGSEENLKKPESEESEENQAQD